MYFGRRPSCGIDSRHTGHTLDFVPPVCTLSRWQTWRNDVCDLIIEAPFFDYSTGEIVTLLRKLREASDPPSLARRLDNFRRWCRERGIHIKLERRTKETK